VVIALLGRVTRRFRAFRFEVFAAILFATVTEFGVAE